MSLADNSFALVPWTAIDPSIGMMAMIMVGTSAVAATATAPSMIQIVKFSVIQKFIRPKYFATDAASPSKFIVMKNSN